MTPCQNQLRGERADSSLQVQVTVHDYGGSQGIGNGKQLVTPTVKTGEGMGACTHALSPHSFLYSPGPKPR